MATSQPHKRGARTRTKQNPRSHAREYALRLLYQMEQNETSADETIKAQLFRAANDHVQDCSCIYLDDCQPRAYYLRFGEPLDESSCPHKEKSESMKKSACKKASSCLCRAYFDEHKTCPEAGYPFKDAEKDVDPCLCIYCKTCDYRKYYNAFDVEPPEYTLQIIKGVEREQAKIDEILSKTSKNWTLMRMPMVDRNILRLAVWEILHGGEDVPSSVAVNEAVLLAKEYGGKDSHKFINGLLGRITLENKERQ